MNWCPFFYVFQLTFKAVKRSETVIGIPVCLKITYTDEEEALMDEILGTAEREERRQRLEERMLMAECMREAQLREKQEKARQGEERRAVIMRKRKATKKIMDDE